MCAWTLPSWAGFYRRGADDRPAVRSAGLAGLCYTDTRKGMDGLAMLVQQVLRKDPLAGPCFAFRGKRGGLVKLLWYDGQGLCLFSKSLETLHFVWPVTNTGRVSLTPAQLFMLLEGIEWRTPQRTHRPELAGGLPPFFRKFVLPVARKV